jgi:hypothetical protein
MADARERVRVAGGLAVVVPLAPDAFLVGTMQEIDEDDRG